MYFMSKRQGAIATSTYGAEFCAMRTAVEEVQAVRYMLCCLGVKIKHATLICGDNKGVIQNCTIPDSLLKKKHVAIAYHKTREAAAAGICHPIKIKSEHGLYMGSLPLGPIKRIARGFIRRFKRSDRIQDSVSFIG